MRGGSAILPSLAFVCALVLVDTVFFSAPTPLLPRYTHMAGLAWLSAKAPDDRRGALLGTAMGAAVVGGLFGPVVGWAASHVGTGPAFSVASIAGAALMLAAFGAFAWLPASVPWLIPVLVLGTPFFGSLYTPAAAMVSESAHEQKLNHGIAFALTNLTWAAGQAVAASASGAIAEASSDIVPYALLAAACLAR